MHSQQLAIWYHAGSESPCWGWLCFMQSPSSTPSNTLAQIHQKSLCRELLVLSEQLVVACRRGRSHLPESRGYWAGPGPHLSSHPVSALITFLLLLCTAHIREGLRVVGLLCLPAACLSFQSSTMLHWYTSPSEGRSWHWDVA